MTESSTPKQDVYEMVATASGADDTRVVVVQQPLARAGDHGTRDPLLRSVLVIAGIAVMSVALLMAFGLLGAAIGFEDTFGIPRRSHDLGQAFVEGVAMIRAMPSTMMNAGDHIVLLPIAGFLAIGVPAALLALARPRVPGAPLAKAGVRGLSASGAVLGIVLAVATVIWMLAPLRTMIFDSPLVAASTLSDWQHWRANLDVRAAVDAFAFIMLVLWCVLGFRLALPRWGRALTGVVLLTACAVSFLGLSMSAGLVQSLERERPQVAGTNVLLLGEVGSARMIASPSSSGLRIEVLSGDLLFEGTASLGSLLARAQKPDEPRP